MNRSLRPDSVRHMSVITAMQRLTAAHRETQRDSSKAAREPGYAQAMGRFRRWWQVLGSNQRKPTVLQTACAMRCTVVSPAQRAEMGGDISGSDG